MKNPDDPLKQLQHELGQLSNFVDFSSVNFGDFDEQYRKIIDCLECAIQKNNAVKCYVKKLKTKILKQKRRNEKKLKTK